MPQSLSKVIVHVIFSTKDRDPWLDGNVHLVTTLPRTLSQADTVEDLKKTSSKWIKGLAPKYSRFYWQRGYGAFSVNPSQLDAVLEYVETQEEHHRTRSFQEEYREFLYKHGVTFDERYVWD